MVRKRAENGTYYHEPPYTWEEDQDFYRRVAGNGVKLKILHSEASPPRTEEPQTPAEKPRRS